MSTKRIADMLALAYEGFHRAKIKNDANLEKLSIKLIAKAMSDEKAPEFFGGIQLALAEDFDEGDDEIHENPFGNDPDIDDNDNGVFDAEDEPENKPASSPSYEGVTDDKDHEDEADENKQKQESSSLIEIVANNFKRLK